MNSALIIGCGNIGALYDLNTDEVLTHAKALFLTKNYNLFFYDRDTALSKRIATQYNGTSIEKVSDEFLSTVKWVSLCSSTNSHHMYLRRLFQLDDMTLLCEKPISYNLEEIDNLEEQYKTSSIIIYVNYIRRFQPAYLNLKKEFSDLFKISRLRECSINYCRGFINNASHAFDTLEFLFDEEIDFQNIKILKTEYDVFEEDPTVSLTARWNDAYMNINGYTKLSKPIFEIRLLFDSFCINFLNAGNDISVYTLDDRIMPVFRKTGCIKNYMENIINRSSLGNSNFLPSLKLNRKLLNYIQS